MKEVYLYEKLTSQKVRCLNCAHYCVILDEKRGVCGARKNVGGKLYALNYGKIIASNIDPIEKKPFFHFLPGTETYSIAAVGCNFICKNCQNWNISQATKILHTEKKQEIEELTIPGENFTPEKIVENAIKNQCPSIAYTYTEPTIFLEFALDTMKVAKKQGLKNIWVSNGFMSSQSAKLIIPYLDANNIDIKSFSESFYVKNCGARLKPVLETAKLMKKSGIWLEITTLAIPGLSDSEAMFKKIAAFICDELGPETPWHISKFSRAFSWQLKDLPSTPVKTLKMAYEIGKKAGLKYVYTGNVPGLDSEDTYCPKCKARNINRLGYYIERFDKSGNCCECGESLNLIFK